MMMYKKPQLNPMMNLTDKNLMSLPTPKNTTLMWNFGFMLFVCLMLQIATGVVLASFYSPNSELSFSSILLMSEYSSLNWLVRNIHANGASLFFVFLYIHIARGIYYHSYLLMHTWMVGLTILVLTMATAFMGYVLPFNQMSFWGASVITNLFSEVPYIGKDLVQLIWGSASVSMPTITRFFAFHFMLPFIIIAMTMLHLNYLHLTGSSNPLGLMSPSIKMIFIPANLLKDSMMFMFSMLVFIFIVMYTPMVFGDNDNFVMANSLETPHHIQPEWYFLFAYAILRSIPNKLGGVIALAMSIIILYSLPFSHMKMKKNLYMTPLYTVLFWWFALNMLLLTWGGACPVEPPYIFMSQVLTFTYFFFFIITPIYTLI